MPNVFSFDDFIPTIHESAFVHPNATVTGNVVIGRGVYIGPGAAIRGGWGGVIMTDVSDDMLAWKTEGTALYQALPARLHATLRACAPRREAPDVANRPPMTNYKPWKETRS